MRAELRTAAAGAAHASAPRDAAVTIRDDAAAADCTAYVHAHPEGSPYHAPAWLDVVRAAFGHDVRYLAAERDQQIAGVLPLVFFRSRIFGRFAVSMPFFNYGGVLAVDERVERALLERAIDETRRAGGAHLELRHTRQRFPELPAKRHKVAMELAVSEDPERQWQALDRKVRNQVRKAEKSNLAFESGHSSLLPDFYEVFARNMRDLGTPVYGANFFAEVLARTPDRSQIFVVRSGSRPVAASLVHWNGDRIEVPWASALREFNPQCANVFLYWQMVRFAAERGFRVFDFGRSTPDEGTYHFKKQWGAVARELVWEYWLEGGGALPQLNPANPRYQRAIAIWQRLPVGVTTRLGPQIVRNIP